MSMKELIEFMARALVDNPDQVEVQEIEGEQSSVIELRVAREDLGQRALSAAGTRALGLNEVQSGVERGDGLRRLTSRQGTNLQPAGRKDRRLVRPCGCRCSRNCAFESRTRPAAKKTWRYGKWAGRGWGLRNNPPVTQRCRDP